MSVEYFEKVADRLPEKKGLYMTNMGELPFDGKTFLLQTGSKKLPTVVDWWLQPAAVKQAPPVVKL